MAEPGRDDQEELKRKLVRRIAFAGVAAVVLLGGLALFEAYLTPEPPAATAPQAAAPPAQPAEAPRPEEGKAEKQPEEAAKPEEAKAEPEKTEMPLAPAPVPETRPASRVVIKPPADVTAAPAKKAAAAKVDRAGPAAMPSPEAKPVLSKVEGADPATVLARSYRLQMGVFTSAANAEELHAKLDKAGIPSYVESRVHVGPFRTQKEADDARRKLKELGLGPGLLIPPQKR